MKNIIKICGITDTNQAIEIAEYGPTHIGMVYFERSPRHINLDKIREITGSIKNKVKTVAITVNPDYKTVKQLLELTDFVQLHGDETIDFAEQFGNQKIIKAFRIRNETDIDKIKPFTEKNYTILIDAFSENAYGGTGKQINRILAKKIIDYHPLTILSGGLSSDNINETLRFVKPFGVDASSKLEKLPGVKDLKKVKKFIKEAKKFYESDY